MSDEKKWYVVLALVYDRASERGDVHLFFILFLLGMGSFYVMEHEFFEPGWKREVTFGLGVSIVVGGLGYLIRIIFARLK